MILERDHLKPAFNVAKIFRFGLSAGASALPALTIAQWGRVQSLNVSIAASLAMYEYLGQNGGLR